MKSLILLLLTCLLGFLPVALFADQPGTIKAVVFVVVDQLGSEPFSHYKPEAGFARLSREALYIPKARYTVLHPETCPGHATIATGTLPWKHGIVENSWRAEGDAKSTYCLDDQEFRVSPRALKRPTLAEILATRGIKTSTISVSGKDRSAVMLAGKKADQVLWYDSKTGDFVSSKYYPDPGGVVTSFNAEKNWMTFFNHPWEVSASTKVPYGFAIEPDQQFFAAIYEAPAVDQLTFELFSRLVRDNVKRSPDTLHVLAISLSALDVVGHHYGSHSEHYRSALRSVDTILDQLLTLVNSVYGKGNYLLSVTGDHGVFPIEQKGNKVVAAEQVSCARAGNKCEGLSEKICYEALDPKMKWYEFARHSYFRGRSEKCLQIYAENLNPFSGTGTTHVTPYPADTEVPIWLVGDYLPAKVSGSVSPAAIVPTFLHQLGVSDLGGYDFDAESLAVKSLS